MFIVALHADLAEEWKRQAVLRVAECFDFFIRPRLLLPKVVRRKRQDLKALLPILFIHLFKIGILRCITAEAGRVHEQQHLAAELAKRNWIPIDIIQRKVIDHGHLCCHEYAPVLFCLCKARLQ